MHKQLYTGQIKITASTIEKIKVGGDRGGGRNELDEEAEETVLYVNKTMK